MIKKKKEKKIDPTLQSLVKLGLSTDEAGCYLILVREGSLTTSQIAKNIKILPNAVYRLVKKLQSKGLVTTLNTYPVTFQAIPPAVAIDSYVDSKERELEEIKIATIRFLTQQQATLPTKVNVLVSQKAFFDKFVELTATAQKEILVISIGETVPDELKIASARAVDRGVVLKFLFHVYNKNNEQLLRSWVRMGIEVRHYQDSGYHLNVFDGKTAVLVANNPENTKERTGMVFYNQKLSTSLRDYFYTIWERAVKIDSL